MQTKEERWLKKVRKNYAAMNKANEQLQETIGRTLAETINQVDKELATLNVDPTTRARIIKNLSYPMAIALQTLSDAMFNHGLETGASLELLGIKKEAAKRNFPAELTALSQEVKK